MNANTTTQVVGSACICGCSQNTINPAANYRPGHDAAHVSALLSVLARNPEGFTQLDVIEISKRLPSVALRVKLQNAADKLLERRAAKALKAAMKIAKKSKNEWQDIDHTVARVGRWTYPVRELVVITETGDQPTGRFQRNEKRDGSGEWIEVENADELVDNN